MSDMSFGLPRNVPDFSNPQRQLEDRVWGRGSRDSLPMYKDKPFGYAPSSRRHALWKRKRALGALMLGVVFVLYMLGYLSSDSIGREGVSAWPWMGLSDDPNKNYWEKRRQHVVEAFQLSWDAYERHGWGAFSGIHMLPRT